MDVYSINMIDSSFTFRKNKKEISNTCDGFLIVSDAFKQFCEVEKYEGLEFVILPASPNFFWLKIHNVVEFDVEAGKTRFMHYNEDCKGYGGIYTTSVCLKNKRALSDSIYRTDICFGDYETKAPIYLVGEMTKQKLGVAGFKEIYFEKILDEYEWQRLGKDPNKLIIEP
jgi:hypothetical protein